MSNTIIDQSILVIAPNWLGDAVMATPALRALKRRFPEASITVAGNPSVCGLLQDLPYINELFPLQPKSSLLPLLRQAKALAPKAKDLTVVLPHSFRSALLAKFVGSKQRIGYARDGRGPLLTRALQPHMVNGHIVPIYMAEEYLILVRTLGAEDDGQGLELCVSESVMGRVRKGLLNGSVPLIAVAPGAAFGPSKQWMPEAFATCAKIITKEIPARFLLLTGPDEHGIRTEILNHAPSLFIEPPDCGTSMEVMKAAIACSNMLICNDSGPRHVAVAFKKPVVCIMGPTSPLYTAGPYEKGVVIRLDLECSPCQKPVCPLEHHRCMREITPEQVAEAAINLLIQAVGENRP